jgi:hypothetical protein
VLEDESAMNQGETVPVRAPKRNDPFSVKPNAPLPALAACAPEIALSDQFVLAADIAQLLLNPATPLKSGMAKDHVLAPVPM